MIEIKLDHRLLSISAFSALNKIFKYLNPSTKIGNKDDIDKFIRLLNIPDELAYQYRFYKGTDQIIHLLSEVIPGTEGTFGIIDGIPQLTLSVGPLITDGSVNPKEVITDFISTELLFFNASDAISFSDIILKLTIDLDLRQQVFTYTSFIF